MYEDEYYEELHEQYIDQFIDDMIDLLYKDGYLDRKYNKVQIYYSIINGFDPLKYYITFKNTTKFFYDEFIDGEVIAINIIIIWKN